MAASGHVHFEQNATDSLGSGPGSNDPPIDLSARHKKMIGKQIINENDVLHDQNNDSTVGQPVFDDSGQPVFDDSGQFVGGSSNGQTANVLPKAASADGQHGFDNNMATNGLNSEQQGTGSNKATGEQRATDGQLDSGSYKAANGSNNEKPGIGSDNGNANGATTSIPQHANARVPRNPATNGHDFGAKFKGKQSFAGLFKENRVPSDDSKLHFISPSTLGVLEFASEDIDSVEDSFGFCLVGYVMGSRPSPYKIKNFIQGWGESVKFTFKQNGWIRFQFPSEASRDTVLHGGPYMILGMQLILKKLPSCFLYSKEDMEFIPSWVQVYGLPTDCWTTNALSKVASVIGRPIHTDMMTITKKGANFARILVEVDVKKPRILDYIVRFPSGKKTTIGFTYEIETKFCDKCKSLGHTLVKCGIEHEKRRSRPPQRQRQGKQAHTDAMEKECYTIPIVGNIEQLIWGAPPGHHGHAAESSGTKSGKDKGVDSEQTPQLHSTLEDACLPAPEEALPDVGLENDGLRNEDKNSIADSDMNSSFMEECDMDSDDLLELLSTVVTQDKEEWKTVKGKNKKGKKNKIAKKNNEGNSGYNDGMGKFFEGMENKSPGDTTYVPKRDTMPKRKQERVLGRKKIDEVRPPNTASGFP